MRAPGPLQRLDHIRTLMAGGIAEQLVFDSAIGSGGDDEQIAHLLPPTTRTRYAIRWRAFWI